MSNYYIVRLKKYLGKPYLTIIELLESNGFKYDNNKNKNYYWNNKKESIKITVIINDKKNIDSFNLVLNIS